MTKAGERGVRLKDNRTESELKTDRAKGTLSEREKDGARMEKRGWCEND